MRQHHIWAKSKQDQTAYKQEIS